MPGEESHLPWVVLMNPFSHALITDFQFSEGRCIRGYYGHVLIKILAYYIVTVQTIKCESRWWNTFLPSPKVAGKKITLQLESLIAILGHDPEKWYSVTGV